MSFTADELQSFNDILDKKLSAHRQDMERLFDQRINILRRDMEQRLIATQQELARIIAQKQTEQQHAAQAVLRQEFTAQSAQIHQLVGQEVKLRQEQQQPAIEGIVDRSLAAQLLAIEELLDQRLILQTPDETVMPHPISDQPTHFEAIEVQTELPWEDLMEVFGKVLDDRFTGVAGRVQTTMQQLEQHLSSRIALLQHQFIDELARRQVPHPLEGNLTNVQEVFQSIEQLERLIESMQVAMTSNHALLSNRLYHHQQLPLERAHPGSQPHSQSLSQSHQAQVAPAPGTNHSLPLPEERGEQ